MGIFYGFSHQRTITGRNAAAHEKAAYDHKADLISKAKAEWAKKNLPPQAKSGSGDSMWLLNRCLETTSAWTDLDNSYNRSGRQELQPRSIFDEAGSRQLRKAMTMDVKRS